MHNTPRRTNPDTGKKLIFMAPMFSSKKDFEKGGVYTPPISDRFFKIFVCGKKKDNEPDPCEGKSPNVLVDITGTPASQICNNNINEHDKGICIYQDDGTCNIECVPECINGHKVHTLDSPGRIFSPCYCEGEYRYSGSCIKTTDSAGTEVHKYTEFTCAGVDSCIDYYDDEEQGITSEAVKVFCETDYCGIGGTNGCEYLDYSDPNFYLKYDAIHKEKDANPELKDAKVDYWTGVCIIKEN